LSFGGFGGAVGGGGGDKGLSLPLTQIFKLAWQDPDLKQRLIFILIMFAVFTFGVHVPVPIPNISSDEVYESLKNQYIFQFLDSFGGGALRRLSVFALGLNPYITASIVIQIMTTAVPSLKKELEEGGQYARNKQNKWTRGLTLVLCIFQGSGFLQMIMQGLGKNIALQDRFMIITMWTAGAMFCLWIGEQISERGIGNGVSLVIFVGIIVGLPYQAQKLSYGLSNGLVQWWSVIALGLLFVVSTWAIVYFTAAQRRIPIQHMRRNYGTKVIGGKTSYLPLSLLMAGVLPIIFASSLVGLPYQFATMVGETTPLGTFLKGMGEWLSPATARVVHPMFPIPIGFFASLLYAGLILFFTYFWTAIQYNVEDISNNLKRAGSYVPGVRPGKQTKDFLDGIISRITLAGAGFIAMVALMQYIAPAVTNLSYQYGVGIVGGTSLLIMVSVALETMRQIEANLLMKQYQ